MHKVNFKNHDFARLLCSIFEVVVLYENRVVLRGERMDSWGKVRARDLPIHRRAGCPTAVDFAIGERWISLGLLVLDMADVMEDDDLEDVGLVLVMAGNRRCQYEPVPKRAKLVRLHARARAFSAAECREMFRFSADDIIEMRRLLRIPEDIILANRTRMNGEEALLILLRRLAYPCRWVDLEPVFGLDYTILSRAFNWMLEYIYHNFGFLVTDNLRFWAQYFESCNHAICRRAGVEAGSLPIAAFIDGKVFEICRPSPVVTLDGAAVDLQREVYNGHKRTHAIKMQAVHLPNGLTMDLFGPVSGRRHDSYMLRESRLNERVAEVQRESPVQYKVYGDAAYGGTHTHISRGHVGAVLTADQLEENQRMSRVRVSVEWGFQKITTQNAYIDYKKGQKLLQQPVAKYIVVATVLVNCHTCLYGSLTSSSFQLLPPTLEEYLRG